MMSEPIPVRGRAARRIYDMINHCSVPDQLDEIARLLWMDPGNGRITDDEALYLDQCIRARRPVRRPMAKPVTALRGRISIFPVRRYQYSPDRTASRHRRRILGGSSALPDGLRHYYTEGQRS